MKDPSLTFYKTLLDDLFEGVYFVNSKKKITFWNKAAEEITGFTKAEVLGKCCSDDILRHVDDHGRLLCQEGCPLSLTLEDGLPREASVYLHHKSGHRVPVAIGISSITDKHQNIIGAVEIFRNNSATIAAMEHIKQLEGLAYLDALTRIANRAYLESFISAKFNELRRLGWSFGLIFADVDKFKQVNDTFGHSVGDEVLKMVGQTFMKNCRSFDLTGRWGGEEFVCVLANLDNAEQLRAIANRIRALVESSWISVESGQIKVTVSMGVTMAQPEDTLETLIERADRLMYEGKLQGRNCVVFG